MRGLVWLVCGHDSTKSFFGLPAGLHAVILTCWYGDCSLLPPYFIHFPVSVTQGSRGVENTGMPRRSTHPQCLSLSRGSKSGASHSRCGCMASSRSGSCAGSVTQRFPATLPIPPLYTHSVTRTLAQPSQGSGNQASIQIHASHNPCKHPLPPLYYPLVEPAGSQSVESVVSAAPEVLSLL